MILRLALRSLAVRPWRTAVLAAGFGLGIAVMAALLGVGEVIIEQAHAPALRGGGDVVVTGVVGPVENARYVVAHVLGAPAIQAARTAVSPNRKTTLYLIKPGMAIPLSARGGVPSLERAVGDREVAGVREWTDTPDDAAWSQPRPEEVLRAMDRFHPPPYAAAGSDPDQTPDGRDLAPTVLDPGHNRPFNRASWAEWLYFNGRSTDSRLRFYLTFLAGPTLPDGRRGALVRLQLDRGGRVSNYSATAAIDAADLIARAPDLDIAGNRVRLDGSGYRITLALAPENARDPRLDGEITLEAPPGRSLPPTAIHGAHGWVSGYVVPVLSGALHGALRIGSDTIPLDGATGYHDHNWGFWEGVRWQWGQVASADLSIVYGRVFPPPTVADAKRIPGVLGVLGPNGPIGVATDVTIDETAIKGGSGDANGPQHIAIVARGRGLDLRLTFDAEESVSTRMGLTRAAVGPAMNFLQIGGTYQVTGRVGDRTVNFSARGAAETFRSSP